MTISELNIKRKFMFRSYITVVSFIIYQWQTEMQKFYKSTISNWQSAISFFVNCQLPIAFLYIYIKKYVKSLNIFTILISFGIMGSLSFTSFSQEIQFSKYDAMPLYLNPALTGQVKQQRLAIASRSQWMKIDGAFNTMGVSYDYNWKRIKSGLGLVVLQDESSNGGFSTFTVAGLYAYHLRVNQKLFFNSGVRVAYIQQKLDLGKLTFADQLIRKDGSQTVEVFDNLKHDFVDISWGNIFFYYDSVKATSYWLGIAFDHLTSPKISFKDEDGKMPVKTTVHGGGRFLLARDDKGYPNDLIGISVLYKSQLKWGQAELGASYIRRIPSQKQVFKEWKKSQPKVEPRYKDLEKGKRSKGSPKYTPSSRNKMDYISLSETQMPMAYVEVGLSYRGLPFLKQYTPGHVNHDAVILLFGLGYYDIKVFYTFDITISKLGLTNSAGAHEVALMYKFFVQTTGKGKTKRKIRKARRSLF